MQNKNALKWHKLPIATQNTESVQRFFRCKWKIISRNIAFVKKPIYVLNQRILLGNERTATKQYIFVAAVYLGMF